MTEKELPEFRERVLRNLRQIHQFVELNAPDPILANAITSFYRMCFGYLGEHMGTSFGKWLAEDTRRYVGLCRTCDNEVSIRKSLLPVCDACETREKVNFLKDEMERRYLEPDDPELPGTN